MVKNFFEKFFLKKFLSLGFIKKEILRAILKNPKKFKFYLKHFFLVTTMSQYVYRFCILCRNGKFYFLYFFDKKWDLSMMWTS